MTAQLEKTDWDRYYSHPFPTASLLRKITCGRLVHALEKTGKMPSADAHVIELGGGGSSFARCLVKHFSCSLYTILDQNPLGIKLFKEQGLSCDCRAEQIDLLRDPLPDLQADLVFSAGLIEHFSPEDTARIVQNHFRLLKPNGCTAFLFPSKTILYRVTRSLITIAGQWHFYDERPLTFAEVLAAAGPHELLWKEMIRNIFLTQGLLLFAASSERLES